MLVAGVGKKSGSEICSLIFLLPLSFLAFLPCFFLVLKQRGPSLSLSPDGCKISISVKLNVNMKTMGQEDV